MESPLVDVEGICVAFGRRPVLHEVSFKVEARETIALVGANGSGKSTLLRSLMRLELPHRGSGTVLGSSIHEDSSQFNARIGYVSEALEFQLPVSLKKIARFYQSLRPEFSISEFDRVCQLFHLETGKQAAEYSRGQRMQFAFALAIAAKPRLILLDEVTAVLDIHVRDLAMREVQKMVATGASAVIATNILTEVVPYADRLVIMDNGRMVLDTGLKNLDERYVKLRITGPEDYGSLDLRSLKGGADGAMTCLVPRERYSEEMRLWLQDRIAVSPEPVTAEDVFLYHCRKGS